MPGFENRASTLQGAGDIIFKLMLGRSTPEQWAEWLRAPLEHAAGTANHDLVQKLIKAGADGSAGWKGCHGQTLLHAAADGGDGQVVSALIRAGAGGDMNAKAPNTGHAPLHLAVLRGKEAAAKMLIMAGADVNILDDKGDAPLHLAVEGNSVGLAQDLLISGADPNVMGSKHDYPLHLAASRGQNEVVLALIHRGANLHCHNSGLNTPLAVAALAEHVSTVEVLLAGGADANFGVAHGNDTALHAAAQHNKAASIPALIEGGADIEARNHLGWTSLSHAACSGSYAVMLRLLQSGASVNTKTNRRSTPLHFACYKGYADAADLLLRWGADETILDNDGMAPSQLMPDIAYADDEASRRLERLTNLLAHAPQDRAWRRRGFVVMCRAHPDRLRLAVNIPDTAAGAAEQQPQESPSRRAGSGHVKVEVQMGGTHAGRAGGGGAGSSSGGRGARRARVEGVGVGFDGVAAWLMALTDEDVFRKIVGFL